MICAQFYESTHVFGLLTNADVLEQKRPATVRLTLRGPDHKPSIQETI